ncbi:MAG TPA: hypothetical protein GXX19_06360 [Syntrophomonadaceae bacterium]|nr:hypothetical protein [Syntrophomonadaceae bacterium]
MRAFLSLLKITFRNYYGISVMKQKYVKEKRELWQPILAVIGLGFGGFTILSLYYLISRGLYTGGKMLGEPALGLEYALLASAFLIFFFGVSSVITTLYFTEDAPFLVSLPLKPFQVIAAKFSLVMANQYLVLAFLLIPPLVIFGRGEGLGFIYILTAVVIFLLFPVIPLAPAAAIVIPLMSRAGSKRLKDLFTILTYVFMIAFGLGLQFLVQYLPKGKEIASLQEILKNHGALLTQLGRGFPPAVWATKALAYAGTGEGLLSLGLFLVLTVVLLALMLLLGERFFYQGLLKGEEVGRLRRAKRKVGVAWGARSPFKALILREHRLFVRTPVYLMNVLPVAVIVPVIAVLPLITQGNQLPVDRIAPFLATHPYVKLVIAAITTFIAGTLPLAASALSREGRLFFISRLIPVPPGDQVKAKFWYILGVNYLCTMPFFVLAVVIARLGPGDILALFILNLAGTAAVTALGILIDLLHPFFDWDNPQRAVKNNLNVLFAMLATLLFLGVFTVAGVGLALVVPWWSGFLILLLLIGGAAVGLYQGQLVLAEKSYRSLEM